MAEDILRRRRPRPGDPDYKSPDRKPRPPSDKAALVTIAQLRLVRGMPETSSRDLILRGVLPVVRFEGSRRIWIRLADFDALTARSVEIVGA
jgi:hypothetical protein